MKTVTGELTLGDKVLSGRIGTINNIAQIGQSENGKALTQSSAGAAIKIGAIRGSQVLELLSHSSEHST